MFLEPQVRSLIQTQYLDLVDLLGWLAPTVLLVAPRAGCSDSLLVRETCKAPKTKRLQH